MTTPALIALDWGTSSFRAWAMTASGEVLDSVESGEGILAVTNGAFDEVFETAVGGWLAATPAVPVIACGMITSRNGWVETPYLPLPAGADELASALTAFTTRKGRTIHFVTGVARNPSEGLPDVIRGEETELVGHLAATGTGDGFFVMPGTHSKWARAEGGRLVHFETVMTGEIYAILSRHSILGRLMPETRTERPEAFRRGIEVSRGSTSSILSRLFSARSLVLFDRLAPEEIADYLSGLLIGEEVRAGLAAHPDVRRITLTGRGDLAGRYRTAFELSGAEVTEARSSMARFGLLEIAKRAGLVR